MDLYEYQEKARSTAIYLDIENSRMLYPALGLIGECGEVAEKVKKLIRDANWNMTPDRMAAISKELGDCCWYLANICCDTNLSLGMMYEMRGSAITHRIHEFALLRLVIHMNRYATAIAKDLECWYYIYHCHPNENSRFMDLPQHISYVIACIEEITHRCDRTLEEIYVANIKNLVGRAKRGTLKGDGDNR